MTFVDLANWFLDLKTVKSRAYYKGLKRNIEQFNAVHGDLFVDQIKPVDLEIYQTDLIENGHSDSYVDQKISSVKTMMNKAFDNDLVSGVTIKKFKKVKKVLKRNSNARDRVLSSDELDRLMLSLSKLQKAKYLQAIVAMAYYTGMRKGEILSLTWDRLDLINKIIRLRATDTKDREARSVPICNELLELILLLPNRIQESGNEKHVFLFQGQPVADIRTGLKTACNEAGIAYCRKHKNGFTFHDLRHTFNTNMRKAGIVESVIMEITGHSTLEMFDRYNTIDDDDTRDAVDRMRSYLKSGKRAVEKSNNLSLGNIG